MKIRDMQILRCGGNRPKLEVWFEGKPPILELRYDKLVDGKNTLYFAEHEGYVSFFADTHDGLGYGGNKFDITLLDGSKESVKGPWSSGSYHMNLFFPKSIDIYYSTDSREFKTLWAGHYLVSEIEKAIERLGLPIKIVDAKYGPIPESTCVSPSPSTLGTPTTLSV